MARTVKEKEYTERRNEILDVAQRLVYSKGYEQMTIQDIQDELQISKGAFYHYFDSKQHLLEALIERLLEQMDTILDPIVHDAHTYALEKFHRFFLALARWKTEQKTFLLALLRVWYKDENALVRQKVQIASVKRLAPLLTTIVHQGIQEGVFTTRFPDQVGRVVMSLIQGLQEAMGEILLASKPKHDALQRIELVLAAYTDAFERVLGSPSGSIRFVDTETLREWIALMEDYT